MLLVVAGIGAGVWRSATVERAQAEVVVARSALGEVADPLAQLCGEDPAVRARVGTACATAAQAAADPAIPGPAGRDGDDGVGITATTVTAEGRLQVTYSDGRTADAGPVRGGDGVSITATSLVDGRLVVTYSDGRTADLGTVAGPPGRGVAKVGQVDGRLIVTLDDGTVLDAGPLPAGPAGAPGSPGPAGPACRDGFERVETGPVTAADGTRYSRSETCVDPASREGG